MLSLTLCMGGTLEAGATALSSPDVQTAEAGTGSEDSFSDEVGDEQQSQTDEDNDSTDEVVVPENPTETPGYHRDTGHY